MTNLFGGIFNEIQTDIKKAVDSTRNLLQVPVFSGLNIKNWFKSSSVLQNPFAKFAFRFVQGRVPFSQFERDFMPGVPNLFPSANSIGFDDAVSMFENLFDELTEDEEREYQDIRYQVHECLYNLQEVIDNSQIIQILEDYQEYDTVLIKDFYFNWLVRTEEFGASLRDQLIDLVSMINSTIQALVLIKLSIDRRNASLISDEVVSYQTIVSQLQYMLNKYPDELESIVERLSELIVYEPTVKVQRSRVDQISQYIKNPLFAFVRADFIKAQLTSISPLAQSFANKGDNFMNQINAAQAAVGQNARLATPDVGGGDKIQQDQQTETMDPNQCVGPLAADDWLKLRGWLFQRESSSDYSKINRYGYCGGYQLGGGALIDLGYAKPGTKSSALAVNSNWTGKDGLDSRESFLGNTSKQDQLVLEYARLNYKRMSKAGTIDAETPKANVAGYLAVAHLLGSGGARDYKNGNNGSDANGTQASEYYNGGSGALGGALPANTGNFTTKDIDEALSSKQAAQSNTLPDEAQVSIPSAGGATVYGYNRVRQFESGHFEEFDNTPGNERVQVRHKTGTGYEFKEDGTAVYFAKGDSYHATAGNDYIVVEGICNIYVKGNVGIVSEGDVNINASNDVNVLAGGDYNVRVGGKYSLQVDGSSNENIKGDSARLVGGFARSSSDGDMQIESASFSAIAREGNMNLLSVADMNLVMVGNYNMTASGDVSSVAKGKMLTVSYGDQSIVAAAKMTINGTDLVAHGTSSAKYSSAGDTTIAGSGPIKLSHPVEKALYSDTAGVAEPGSPDPVNPSGSASDGGGGQIKTDNEKRPEKKKIEKVVEQYTAQTFDSTMSYSGGGEGKEPSKVDPLTIA